MYSTQWRSQDLDYGGAQLAFGHFAPKKEKNFCTEATPTNHDVIIIASGGGGSNYFQ